jgi:pimeloyl-ACP methyl ester carboxylesterase
VRARVAALLLAACAASGCASLADRIVDPPGHSQLETLLSPADEQVLDIRRGEWRTPEGVTLAYRAVSAGARGTRFEFNRHTGGGGDWHFRWQRDSVPTPLPNRGTVVYLSGWGESGASMLPWAMLLAEHGYRGIAVDLRNTGRSSHAPNGFGPREAADVAALVAHLQDSGEVQGPVYLFGVSYGAATALFAEPALRGRLAGIVAMEPYANAADAIRTMIRGVLAEPAHGAAQRMVASWMQHRYDSTAVERAIIDLDKRLDLDLSPIDLHAPLAQSQTCTLLLHGRRDTWIPPAASRGLAAVAPSAHYTELPDEGHMTLPLRLDWLVVPLADWLARAGAGQCTALALPPDPADVLPTQ